MPGPLNLAQLKLTYRNKLLAMKLDMVDQNGNKVILSPDPNGNMLQYADALAEAFYEIAKDQILVQVSVATPVPATPGVFPGTGTGIIQ